MTLKSLVEIRMNKISLVTVKSLIFLFWNRDKGKHKLGEMVKGSGEDEIGITFLKIDIYDPF